MNDKEVNKPAHEILKSSLGLNPAEARDYVDRKCLDDLDLRREVQNFLLFRAFDSTPSDSLEFLRSDSDVALPETPPGASVPAIVRSRGRDIEARHPSTRRYFERLEGGARLACLLQLGDTYRVFIPTDRSGSRFIVLEYQSDAQRTVPVPASLSQCLFLCLRSAGALAESFGGGETPGDVSSMIARGQEARCGSRTQRISTEEGVVTIRELTLKDPVTRPPGAEKDGTTTSGPSRSRRQLTLEEIEASASQYFVFVDEDRSIEFTGRFVSEPFPHISQDGEGVPVEALGAFEQALRRFEGRVDSAAPRRPTTRKPGQSHSTARPAPIDPGQRPDQPTSHRGFIVTVGILVLVVFLLQDDDSGLPEPDLLFRSGDFLTNDDDLFIAEKLLITQGGEFPQDSTGTRPRALFAASARSLSSRLEEDTVVGGTATEVRGPKTEITAPLVARTGDLTRPSPIPATNNEETTTKKIVAAIQRDPDTEVEQSGIGQTTVSKEAPGLRRLEVSNEYARIQQAIDDARVGDTVVVGEGEFEETLTFKSGVIIEGAGPDRSVVLSKSSNTILLVQDCKAGKISSLGFRHTNSSLSEVRFAGISLFNSSVEIENCHVSSSDIHGLSCSAGDTSHIRDCVFEANLSAGIYVTGAGTKPTLISNVCRQNEFGIYFERQSTGHASQNRCEDNKVGILVSDAGTSPTLIKNSCLENEIDGIHFRNGSGGNARENVCNKNTGSGIGVRDAATTAILVENQCSENEVQGIYFRAGSTGNVEGNSCENNGQAGISVLDPHTHPELSRNKCNENHRYGVFVGNSATGMVIMNTCDRNIWSGIGVSDKATKADVLNNKCRENGKSGIVFQKGGAGLVKTNTCSENRTFGIEVVDPGSQANLQENTCTENTKHGVSFRRGATGKAQSNTCVRNKGSGIGVSGRGTDPEMSGNICNENSLWGFSVKSGTKALIGAENKGSGNKRGLGL